MRLSVFNVKDQETALRRLAQLAQKDTVHPRVMETARILTAHCRKPRINGDENDRCEVDAVFQAVKHGDDRIPGLENGLRYTADPRWADSFTAPNRILEQIARGANGCDCDDHTGLMVALLGSLGFLMGLRVWGKNRGNYVHVYPVVALPKRDPSEVLGLDTTVHDSKVGWEPPGGVTMTAWLE